ncbi:PREDICTED: uncharacterized protein CXorf66 homolog [Chrysochloris asiatica]|uniref:Uncharacterized protein CXorf66 homolog n=1 Tax=Chrysochloris asiatica TaxID=185453 RepID=A0A9B0TS86_CHRAS|nr:PREDICTED: uncharacterized protein CXorf66 homolog [Chrysochloris asiatica]
MLSRPLLPKTCHCYKERCLVCKTSEPLLKEISESDVETCHSDDDSDKEILIICNVQREKVLPITAHNNEGLKQINSN